MAKKDYPVFEAALETYTAHEIIGEGGAGKVYRVTSSDGELLALKCLAPDRITRERVKRFKNEIEFGRRTVHGNIVKITDTGAIQIDGVKCPFYVMPLYPGTLRGLMKQLGPGDAQRYFSQLLDGVEAAHLHKVWHRDLKPENVLWDKSGDRLLVADFGVAHFEEDEIYTAVETKVAARLANFQYAAPEQRARGTAVDQRADIFALGLILNEMFTGEVRQGAGHKRIGDIDPKQAYLDDLVELMTQQNPANRPAAISAIKSELIGRQRQFVSQQKLDEARRQVVKASEPEAFKPISIIDFDYVDGRLLFQLDRAPPEQWRDEFRNPSVSTSYLSNYHPQVWTVAGNQISVTVNHENENTMQRLVNYAKQYVESANRTHERHLVEEARSKEREQREAQERRVAAAAARARVLKNVRL
jgi:serine/threonine protein kinase